MGLGRVMDALYQFCVWLMRLAYLNILWIAFSLLGLIIVGFAPATLAMFSVIRKWMMGEKEVAIFPLFWKSYREEFFRANIIFLILAAIGWIFYIDFQIFKQAQGTIFSILKGVAASFALVYALVTLTIFPVLAHYQFKTLEYFKYTFLIVLSSPLRMLLMILSLVLVALVFLTMPGLIVFFSGSLFGLMIMFVTSKIFNKIDETDIHPSVGL